MPASVSSRTAAQISRLALPGARWPPARCRGRRRPRTPAAPSRRRPGGRRRRPPGRPPASNAVEVEGWRPAGRRVTTPTSAPCTQPSGPPCGLVKVSAASVWVLRVPRAGNSCPPKPMRTPSPRAAGFAAAVTASPRFRGPSLSGASAARCAPVRTTGRSSSWKRSRKNAVSSVVSVPWVTTTPATSGSRSCAATARARVCTRSSVMRKPLTVNTSSTRTSMPGGRSSRATRAAPASWAVDAPPPRIGWRSFRRSPARSPAARATSTSIGCRDPIRRGPAGAAT